MSPKDWLLPDRESFATDVVAYNDAEVLYPAMAEAIRKADQPGHLIYLLGWHVEVDGSAMTLVHGDPTTSLRALLTKADAAGVQVRAMYDYDYLQARNKENAAAVSFINGLKHGAAVHDARYLMFGAHHQKLLIISGSDGAVAFVGGWDIHPHRWGWVDVEVRLTGGAASKVLELFRERWQDHPRVWLMPASKQVLPAIPSAQRRRAGPDPSKTVQIVRTYGNAPDHGGVDWFERGVAPVMGMNTPATYAFAPSGESSDYALVLRALGRARRFIYCEDQYLYASRMKNLPDIRDVLAKQLASVPGLQFVALVSRSERIEEEVRQAYHRRRQFIGPLRAGNPGRVHVVQYKAPNPYVHSKCWIIDDEFALVGSANCNRRGYSHDSEAGAGIVGLNASGRAFAHDLRIQLWLRHLNPGGGAPPVYSAGDVEDFAVGLKLLTASGSPLEPYDEKAGPDDSNAEIKVGPVKVARGDAAWAIIDPDGS